MKRMFADYLVRSGRLTPAQREELPNGQWLSREPVGRLALLHGLIQGADIDRILSQQRAQGGFFGEIAVEFGLMTQDQLETLLVAQRYRECLELVEELALLGLLSMSQGLGGLCEFVHSAEYESIGGGSPMAVIEEV